MLDIPTVSDYKGILVLARHGDYDLYDIEGELTSIGVARLKDSANNMKKYFAAMGIDYKKLPAYSISSRLPRVTQSLEILTRGFMVKYNEFSDELLQKDRMDYENPTPVDHATPLVFERMYRYCLRRNILFVVGQINMCGDVQRKLRDQLPKGIEWSKDLFSFPIRFPKGTVMVVDFRQLTVRCF